MEEFEEMFAASLAQEEALSFAMKPTSVEFVWVCNQSTYNKMKGFIATLFSGVRSQSYSFSAVPPPDTQTDKPEMQTLQYQGKTIHLINRKEGLTVAAVHVRYAYPKPRP